MNGPNKPSISFTAREVKHLLLYLETHYHGTVLTQMEPKTSALGGKLLLTATFVPDDGTANCGGGVLFEVPDEDLMLHQLQDLVGYLLLTLQEVLEVTPPNSIGFRFLDA